MKQMKHWQDPVNALLGVWLVLSPWALGFQGEIDGHAQRRDRRPPARGRRAGRHLPSACLGGMDRRRVGPVAGRVALGCSDSARSSRPGWTAVATGVVVIVLALWVLMTDKDYAGWLGGGTAQ